MPRGGRRKKGTSEKEVEEAAERMRNYPEYLGAARDSDNWIEFLDEIGVYPESLQAGRDFWEEVRGNVIEEITGFSPRKLAEANAEIVSGKLIYFDESGKFTTEEQEGQEPIISYRSKETGRFVSRKSIEG